MAVSTVPSLIDALVTLARSNITDARVSDGIGRTDDPGDFLMIGVEDPDVEGAAQTADVQQDWANANSTARDESGDITCAALSWTGDGSEAGQKASRDAVYATADALAGALRANPSLGLPTVLWTSFGTRLQFSQGQDTGGAFALLTFTVYFRARI